MKKYRVTLYYHTNVTVEVEAQDEEEALENACEAAATNEYDYELLSNLVEDSDPDIEEI